MVDQVLTKQKLIDADIDVNHLGEAVNAKKVITPRTGAPFKSLPLIASEYEQNGATRGFNTLAEFNAVKSTIPAYTVVTISEAGANQGLNVWNGTTLTKSAYDPLTQAKEFVGNTGYASIVGVLQSNINYVTATRTLEFNHGINVVTGTNTYSLSTPQSVELPLNTPSRLEYVVSSGSIVVVARNASRVEGNLVIGIVTATGSTLKTLDFAFTVDGVVQNPPHFGELVTDTATRINFNNATATLELNGGIRVKTNYTTTDLSTFTLAQRTIAYPTLTGFYTLQYDLTAQAFSFRSISVNQPLNTADIATVKFVSSVATDVWGIDVYSINSERAVQFREGIQIGNLIPVSESDVNFDFVTKELKIAATRVRLVSSTARPIILPAVTLDISGDEGSLKRVLYNTQTATFRAVQANTSTSTDEVQVALFHLNDKFVSGVPYYSVNGVAAGAAADATTKANAAEANAKDYFSNNGDAKLIAIANSNINYTISDRLLNFANTVYVITPTSRYTLTTPASVSLPVNTKYRIEYNIASNSVRAVGYSAAKTENWLVLGFVTVDANGISTSDFEHTVNGQLASNSQLGQVFTNSNLTINIDTTELLFDTRANGRVISGDRNYTLPTASVALPTTNAVYRVEYNPYTSLVEINTSSSTLKRGNIIFARLVVASGVYTLYGVDTYSVNGVVVDAAASSGASNTGKLLGQTATDINFDFVAQTLTIVDQKVRFLRNGKTSLLAGQVLDISTSSGGAWSSIVVTAANVLAIRPASLQNVDGDIVVGQLRVSDQQVQDIPYFSIQGKASKPSSQLKTANFLVPFGNVEPDYSQPELPSYDAMRSANNGDYNKFYALYDALLAAHPDYITKTTLGNDALGNPLHQYQFTTPEVGTTTADSKKAKIVIFTGIHGGEKAGMYNVYFALKEIAERWQADKHLEALYWGVNFIVLPVVNPTGYNENSRFNHNNVDLARNFTANWSAALANGGTAPLDQAESVIMDAVMSNNTDALYLCSHHNFGDSTTNFIWNASASYFSRSLAKNLIIGQTIKAKARYSWMPQVNNYYIGYADLGQPSGSEGRQAVDKYGINASSFEISSSFAWEVGMPTYSGAVATIGVETFINWLLMNIKYAPQLYNTRINL